MDWQEEPATNKQLSLLQEYGFVPAHPLTVTQAARLIRQYSKHPPRPTTGPQPAQPLGSVQQPVREDHRAVEFAFTEKLNETARLHAYGLRLAVLALERSVKENSDRPGVRADLHSAIAARQQFWFDTCRDAKDLQTVSVHALEFYQHFGARFFPPSWQEVEKVLEALDGAMARWDKDHPELFFETLKLNFPSLLRHK